MYTLTDAISSSYFNKIADKARELGFEVKFIYDGDYYIFIHLKEFEYLLPKYKKIAELIGNSGIFCGCGIYCDHIYPEAAFADSVALIDKLYNMEFHCKLFIRNKGKIPAFVWNNESQHLLYEIITDKTKDLYMRTRLKKNLHNYFTYTNELSNYKATIHQLEPKKYVTKEMAEDYDKPININHKMHVSYDELERKGKINSININVETKSEVISWLIQQNDFYYCFNDDNPISYQEFAKHGDFTGKDLVWHNFDVYFLEKDADKACRCILNVEFPNLHHLYSKEDIIRMKEQEHVIFYIPAWMMYTFNHEATRNGIEYRYLEKDPIIHVHNVPFIAPLRYYEQIKGIMDSYFNYRLRNRRIYAPEKELALYPEAKDYADISGKYKIVPEKRLDKYME